MKRFVAVTALLALAGCPGAPGGGGGGGPVETSLILDSGLGTFDVVAGVPETRAGTVRFSLSEGNLSSASLSLDPDALGVAQAKDAVALQGGVLTVAVRLAEVDQLDTVCDAGEEYGPFEVTLDEANNPTAIDPDTIELSETTLALLEGGEFSICIEVTSPIDATVTIESFGVSLEF